MNETEDRQKYLLHCWLNTGLNNDNDDGPIFVKDRIAYLTICNGGYHSNQNAVKYAGKVIGPFVIGLPLNEVIEHAYYMGMLSGIELICIDPYEQLNSYVEDYIRRSLLKYDVEIDATGIINSDGALNLSKLFSDYMNPIHGGDDN